MTSVGAELPRQMARAARKVSGLAAAGADHRIVEALLVTIECAAEAIAEQDVVAHLRCFEDFKALSI
ncbi:hypothetical protein FHS31_000799 [Sphingomonas vulcanisoli]|uniref:Uncharacterized protein n=1 Tax=Sphingomonas vulcanisoli TaxID=1658060 RepID=A0ABX0TQ41_9SPHN|nr:hypothetical protein [Sphingomonas vulcanisoli]NIJ07203.1 hypothetical protein [Sphingomonas vulcanisoli]